MVPASGAPKGKHGPTLLLPEALGAAAACVRRLHADQRRVKAEAMFPDLGQDGQAGALDCRAERL